MNDIASIRLLENGPHHTCMDSKYRLYSESVEIRDLESRGPWAVAAERSEDATKGLRLSKSRISIGRAV